MPSSARASALSSGSLDRKRLAPLGACCPQKNWVELKGVPVTDVRTDLLVPSATVTHSPSRGDAQHYTIKAWGREAVDAARRYVDFPDPRAPRPPPAGLGGDGRLVRGGRGGLHPPPRPLYPGRHPGHLPSRPGRAGGRGPGRVNPRPGAVRDRSAAALVPAQDRPAHGPAGADRHGHPLPYKGQAQYWSFRLGDRVVEDVAWSYRTTLPESQKIAGLVAFYNEEVDLFIDDQLQERRVTKFSRSRRAR